MKNTQKAILASVLVLALCLSAVGGVTYSWFTDEESTEVNVTAGQMKLITSNITGTVQSYGGNPIELVNGVPTHTDVGGTVTLDYTAGTDVGTITVNAVNGVPGDIITLNFTNTIDNNINVNYYVEDKVIDNSDVPLATNPFTIFTTHTDGSILEQTWDSVSIVANAPNNTFDEKLVIQFNESAGNQYQGRAYSISVDYNLIQGNIIQGAVSNKAVMGGTESEFTVALANSDVTRSIVELPTMTEDVKVSIQAISDDPLIALHNGDVILGGIDVAFTDVDGNPVEFDDIATDNAIIKMILGGDWTDAADSLVLYHEGEVIGSGLYDISFDGENTVIKITANDFSPYTAVKTVVPDGTVAKNLTTGASYETLQAAIDTCKENEVIKMFADVSVDSLNVAGKTATIDMNGHTLGVSKTGGIWAYNGASVAFAFGKIISTSVTENTIPIIVGVNDATYGMQDYLILMEVDVSADRGAPIFVTHGSNVWIDGGSINSEFGAGVITNGSIGRGISSFYADGVEFNIGRTLIDENWRVSSAIQIQQSGDWTINDCTFNVYSGPAMSVRGGNVTITDCEYTLMDAENLAVASGKIQYTDVNVDVNADCPIAVYYKPNAYGYPGDQLETTFSLTIDGDVIDSSETGEHLVTNAVHYFGIDGTPANTSVVA